MVIYLVSNSKTELCPLKFIKIYRLISNKKATSLYPASNVMTNTEVGYRYQDCHTPTANTKEGGAGCQPAALNPLTYSDSRRTTGCLVFLQIGK